MNKNHTNYKIPYKEAKKHINPYDKNMQKIIAGAINSSLRAHNNHIHISSLSKRIYGALREYYARLLMDRLFINYLSVNRIDLSKINGEFRMALLDIINNES